LPHLLFFYQTHLCHLQYPKSPVGKLPNLEMEDTVLLILILMLLCRSCLRLSSLTESHIPCSRLVVPKITLPVQVQSLTKIPTQAEFYHHSSLVLDLFSKVLENHLLTVNYFITRFSTLTADPSPSEPLLSTLKNVHSPTPKPLIYVTISTLSRVLL